MTHFAHVEAQIRHLHARCADAVWRKDAVAFAQCYTPDGEWRIAGTVLCGREQIAATIAQVLAPARGVLMTFRTPLLDVAEGTATGRVYVTEQCAWTDRPAHTTIGCYHERYVESGEGWRFSWRLFQLHYLGPPDLSGTFFDNPDYGAWPTMPPRDEVPPALDAPAPSA